MSDSDSVSDSDSQSWTFVGPEGTVDSSDHDSDIVVLRDDAIEIQNSNEAESTEVKTEIQSAGSQSEDRVRNPEADPEFCGADFRQKTSDASTEAAEAKEALETGLDVEEKKIGILLPTEAEKRSQMSAVVDATTSSEENREASCSNVEPVFRDSEAGSCVEMGYMKHGVRRQSDDKGSMLDDSARAAGGSLSQWEFADPEEPNPDSLLNGGVPANSCLHSGILASALVEKAGTSDDNEGLVSDGDANADDVYEEDEDDDELVVRKFHEATLHSSLNRHPLHLDDRNESHQNREEDEFLPPDIDDRCESDISGIADDSDSDLSSLAGIDDLQLHPGNFVRTYRHQPNSKFNKCLTLIAATAVLFAVGIGIGHYIGSTRDSTVQQRQFLHLKILQDEYFVCLHDKEKLESKLVIAKDSDTREKLNAVSAAWKKKYEELVFECADLQFQVTQMQERVKVLLLLKKNYEEQENIRKIERTNEPELSSKPMDQKQEISKAPGTPNERKSESEMRSTGDVSPKELDQEHRNESWLANVTHKLDTPASGIPENVSDAKTSISSEENINGCWDQVDDLKMILEKKSIEIGLLKNDANQLAVENSDLKAAIQSQRYKEHPKQFQNVAAEEKVGEVRQDGQEMHGSASFGNPKHQSRKSFIKQQRVEEINFQYKFFGDKDNRKESSSMQQWQKSTISLLKFFTDQSLIDSESTSFNNKSTSNLSSCFAALENITTGDNSLSDFFSGQTLNKEDLGKKIAMLKNRMKEILRLCQHSVDYKSVVSDSQNKLDEFIEVSTSQQNNETQNHTKLMHKFIKRLRSAVQDVIRSIDSLPKAVAATSHKQKMKTEVKNWANKVRSGWKKIEEAVSLIRGQKQQNEGYVQREPWQTSHVREAETRSSVLRSVDEKSNQAFDGNRDHKQTESSSSHQRYEEFWKWNHFDPDDFLQEGFFEDNQREWHKHQKRLRKISGRIQRLTEEMLLSMDDDDIEDIYEDIDDLADDVEDREVPEQLRTWLSCQTRWWRSRVHRKHRNEDLVKGCGQQLMHWQLRVLCKDKAGRNKWSREGHKYHKFCKAVISSQGRGLNHGHFVFDNRLFRQGAKTVELKHFPPKMDDTVQHTGGDGDSHFNNLSGADGVQNTTHTDHSAYNIDSWSDPVESSYFANGQIFPQQIHQALLDRSAAGQKSQNDQALHCHEHGKFSKFTRIDEQWCEK